MPPERKELLESLFVPCSAEQFLDRYWPDKPFIAHGDPARLPHYLRSEKLSSFGKLAAGYRGRVAFGNAVITDKTVVAKDVSVGLLRKMGLSLYLLDLPDYVPGTVEFLREVEQSFGAKTGTARIGAFAAPVHNGVTSHFDSEEVISVQLEGAKRFYIAPMRELRYPYGKQYGPGYNAYEDLYPQMAAGIPNVDNAEFQCVEMRPGSVLFMPRGMWHRTEATEESLSVSIILRQPASFEYILEKLKQLLLRDPEWRRPLYRSALGNDRLGARIAALLQDLPNVCGTIDPGGILDDLLPEHERIANIGESNWVQRVPHIRLQITPHPRQTDVWHGSIRANRHGEDVEIVLFDISAELFPLLQWLSREDRPVRVADLLGRFPGISGTDVKAVLQALLRATYLKLVYHMPQNVGD